MEKSTEELFDDTLRPMAIKNQVAELVGDGQTPGTMLHQLTGLMQHIINNPEVKIKTLLPTAKQGFDEYAPHTLLERSQAFQVNQKALEQVYEIYAVDRDDTKFKVIKDEAGHYIQTVYPSPAGITFVEQWHYFPDHNDIDFVPDAFNVLVLTDNFNQST
jgi:hypothetical protein